MEKATFWIALAGALAWIPPLVSWIHKYLVKPDLTIIVQDQSEIGYTSNGPITNFFISLSSDSGALITNIDLHLVGPTQDQHNFKWEWFEETFFDIGRADLGISTPVTKNQRAIALKVLKEGLVEKKMGFYKSSFKTDAANDFAITTERYTNITQAGGDGNTIRTTNEYNNYKNLFAQSCFWREGEYNGTFNVKVLNVDTAFKKNISFKLTAFDITKLQKNVETLLGVLERHYTPAVAVPALVPLAVVKENSNLESAAVEVIQVEQAETAEPVVTWNWAHPLIVSLD